MKPIQEDEMNAVRELILLPMLLTAFERDKKIITDTKLKYQRPYIDTIDKAMDRVTKEVVIQKRFLGNRGIKILKEAQHERSVIAEYMCRGIRGTFEMLWYLVRAELEVRMTKYLSGDKNDDSKRN